MIRRKTTLVLGAGASHPYGYPLGGDLVAEIIRCTAPGTASASILAEKGDLAGFRRRLARSEVGSIDEFLEANMEFAAIGKLAIAIALTIRGPDATSSPPNGGHWLQYLWSRLREGAPTSQQFRENQLRIVTYNYEDSVHRYLRGVLSAFYTDLQSCQDDALNAFVESAIPIIHLHGSLSHADDVVIPHQDRTRFINEAFLTRAAKQLRIIHEATLPDEYNRAREWLGQSDRIYFMGFGYHPTNCKRLNMREISGPQGYGRFDHIQGTALGLGEAEVMRACSAIGLPSQFLHDQDCLKFLRVTARLD